MERADGMWHLSWNSYKLAELLKKNREEKWKWGKFLSFREWISPCLCLPFYPWVFDDSRIGISVVRVEEASEPRVSPILSQSQPYNSILTHWGDLIELLNPLSSLPFLKGKSSISQRQSISTLSSLPESLSLMFSAQLMMTQEPQSIYKDEKIIDSLLCISQIHHHSSLPPFRIVTLLEAGCWNLVFDLVLLPMCVSFGSFPFSH